MTLADAYMQIVYLLQATDYAKIKPTAAIAKLKSLTDKVAIALIFDANPLNNVHLGKELQK